MSGGPDVKFSSRVCVCFDRLVDKAKVETSTRHTNVIVHRLIKQQTLLLIKNDFQVFGDDRPCFLQVNFAGSMSTNGPLFSRLPSSAVIDTGFLCNTL